MDLRDLLRRSLVPAGIAVLSVLLVVLVFWDPGGSSAAPTGGADASPVPVVETGRSASVSPHTTPPDASASASPDASPSGAPSSVAVEDAGAAPLLPAAARGLTVPAASAFVRYFFEQAINHAKVTGDVSAIRLWSAVGCTVCAKNVTAYTVANQANGLHTGDHRWRAMTVRQASLTDPRTVVVEMTGAIGNHTYRAGPKAKLVRYEAHTVALRLTLIADQGNWAMFDWERLVR